MRKITEEAFTAWINGERFKKSNTEVTANGDVRLHGNLIVRRDGAETLVSDGGWGWSATTRERLSPWITFSRKDWEPLMDGTPYISGTWVKATFPR